MSEVTTSGPSNGACLDCHRRYGDEHGFPDLIVPDDVWEAINPGSDGGGMLCPSCICARAYRAGVRAVAYFASGPFEQDHPQNAAQAPQDGANGGDVGSGKGEGENGAPECPCAACDPGISLTGDDPIWLPSRMNVCPDCGNKRCPKAADHARWQCNDSNEVGQVARPVEKGDS
jgi:hypothetical protein